MAQIPPELAERLLAKSESGSKAKRVSIVKPKAVSPFGKVTEVPDGDNALAALDGIMLAFADLTGMSNISAAVRKHRKENPRGIRPTARARALAHKFMNGG